MFNRFERMLAGRYLRARRREGFISVIAGFSLTGIALGVATLIVVLAVMNGFRGELLGRILGLNGHLNVFPVTVEDTETITHDVMLNPDVVSAVPMIESQAFVTSQRGSTGVIVRAFDGKNFAAKPIIRNGVQVVLSEDLPVYVDTENKETLPAALLRHELVSTPEEAETLADYVIAQSISDLHVAIGYKLAQQLGVRIGDTIRLISPQAKTSPLGTPMIRNKTYKIAMIYNVGMIEYDGNFVFMGMQDARTFFQLADGQVTAIEIMVADPDAMGTKDDEFSLLSRLIDTVGDRGHTRSWQESNAQFFGALQVERNVMFLILTLIILVAAFNIISSLIMLVKDKGKDIAILRTMGATPGNVMRIFLMTGASIGMIGTIVGLLLGVAFAENIQTIQGWVEAVFDRELFPPEIYFLSNLPATVDYHEVLQVVLMGMGLSFLATVYPSWRASRLDPVEALRYE